jgi:hypothetical protein
MTIISKLSDKCKKCTHVDNCDNKRMVACAYFSPIINNASMPITKSLSMPSLSDTSIQAQIAEQPKRALYKNIFKMNCAFNKS